MIFCCNVWSVAAIPCSVSINMCIYVYMYVCVYMPHLFNSFLVH